MKRIRFLSGRDEELPATPSDAPFTIQGQLLLLTASAPDDNDIFVQIGNNDTFAVPAGYDYAAGAHELGLSDGIIHGPNQDPHCDQYPGNIRIPIRIYSGEGDPPVAWQIIWNEGP